MASTKIRGITIEFEGDASKLTQSLREVDKSLKSTQNELRDVDKLLKLDPKNVELLRQKQTLLSSAVENTQKKLDEEKKALEALKASPDAEKTLEQQRALERDIAATNQQLQTYQGELETTGASLNHAGDAAEEFGKDAEQASEQAASSLEKVGNSAQQVADKTKALSAAAAALGTALIANAYKSAQTADELNTLSKQTGFSVEELQKMQYASELVDVSFDTMTGSIKKLTMKMSSGASVFEELGVSIYDADGNMRDATDVWYDAIAALSQIENETERDAMSMELFGKSAMDMSGIVDDGGAALREFGQEAEDAGLILSEDAVSSANEFNDAMDRLKARTTQAMAKAGAALAGKLVPALEKIVDKVSQVLSWFANLDGTTQKLILVILGLVAAISPMAAIIAKVTTAVNALKMAFTVMTGPVGLVVAAIAAAIAIGVLLYKNWDTIKAKAVELWEKVTTTFNNIRDNIADRVNSIKAKISEVFGNIVYTITHPFETAKEKISDLIEKIKGLFNFEWSWPKIKLPHFRITSGSAPWGLFGQGTKPTFEIDWYARAMKNGMILNNPTIFGYGQNGSLLGAGESGSETIVGTNSLMGMIRQAAAGAGPTINMTVNAQGMSADELSSLVVDKITTTLQRNSQRW